MWKRWQRKKKECRMTVKAEINFSHFSLQQLCEKYESKVKMFLVQKTTEATREIVE